MSIISENALFDWRVRRIAAEAREIESATHLFEQSGLYDTALEKLELRLAARRLRETADKLDGLQERLCGPATAFPEAAE